MKADLERSSTVERGTNATAYGCICFVARFQAILLN